MTDLLMWTILFFPPALAAVGLFLGLPFDNKPAPAPEDPLAVEARRLAEREVAEMDWRLGTGPEPEWLKPPKPVVEETLIEKYTRKIEDAMGVMPIILKGDPERVGFVERDRFVKTVEEVAELAELAARDAERRGIIREIVPGGVQVGPHFADSKPDPPAPTVYRVKNGLGEVLYEYTDDGFTAYPAAKCSCQSQEAHYPRPRHKKRPHPGTQSRGAG